MGAVIKFKRVMLGMPGAQHREYLRAEAGDACQGPVRVAGAFDHEQQPAGAGDGETDRWRPVPLRVGFNGHAARVIG